MARALTNRNPRTAYYGVQLTIHMCNGDRRDLKSLII